MKDERVEIDAFKIMLIFIYSAYTKLKISRESVLAVLYIGIIINE